MNQVKIGEFITTIRKEKGLTQRQLAEQIGVSDKTISKWECGRGLPEMSMMEPLCETLQVNINEFLSGERLSEESYSKKAEENMMKLMQESENNKKKNRNFVVVFIAGFVIILLALVYMIAISLGSNKIVSSIVLFLDFPTLLSTLGITVLFLAITGLWKSFWKAITFSGSAYESSDIIKMKEAIRLAQKSLIGCGLLVSIISFIIIGYVYSLNGMTLEVLGANIAVALLGAMYGIVGYMLLLPIRSKIETI